MPGEFDIIREYFAAGGLQRDDVLVGIGDDGAAVQTQDTPLVLAVDALVEGVHFPIGTPARAIGHRAVAVNLSDLAAMAATPAWVTLALALPRAEPTWLADFAAGFFELCEAHQVQLIGGDTVRGPMQITVQAAGHSAQPLCRSGGQAGDDVYVSGYVGDAAGGLRLFGRDESSHPLVQRFLYPTPRVELGSSLSAWASACIDVSDGLAVDARHLASASGAGMTLMLDRLPLSDALCAAFGPDEAQYLALNGGDDYELCFSVPAARRDAFTDWCDAQGHVVTRIGQLEAGDSLTLKDRGEAVSRTLSGFDHFAEDGG
ncbi:MAG: thiamine-phosphate kinase [Gammaproteobacteria bacterium]